jgi:hypothetical protein
VYAIARDIHDDESSLTSEVLASNLSGIPEWRNKLNRANFTPEKIEEAIQFLRGLRLVGSK